MKTSYVIRLPYERSLPKCEMFALSEVDIFSLKAEAASEGRSLKVFIAKELKIIAMRYLEKIVPEEER